MKGLLIEAPRRVQFALYFSPSLSETLSGIEDIHV